MGAALRSPAVAGQVVAARGITKNTFKTFVRRALKKVGAGSIADLRSLVLERLAEGGAA